MKAQTPRANQFSELEESLSNSPNGEEEEALYPEDELEKHSEW